jgi:hypothetical protein
MTNAGRSVIHLPQRQVSIAVAFNGPLQIELIQRHNQA